MGIETETETPPGDFTDMVDTHLGGDEALPETPPVEETPPPAPEAPVEETPPVEAAEESPASGGGPDVPVEQPKAAEVPPEKTSEELEAEATKWREDNLRQLNEQYTGLLTEEQMAEWETNPRGVLAQVLANAHMSVYESLRQGFQPLMADAANQQLAQYRAVQEYEKRFYDSWPKLRGVDEAKLGQILQAYRASRPGTAPEEEIQDVGIMAHTIFKIAPDEPKAPTPAKPSTPKAFKPAAPGGSSPPPDSGESDNPFTEMVEALLSSEDFSR